MESVGKLFDLGFGLYFLLLYLISSVAIGVFYAGRLDRWGGFWGLFCLAFTPIVGFICLFALGHSYGSDPALERDLRLVKKGVLKECSHCLGHVPARAGKCRLCGSVLG